MKLKKFVMIAAMGAMFAACSNDGDLQPGNQQDPNQSGSLEGKTGYFSLNLNLSANKGTRAASYDDNDGVASEYSVQNYQVYLFKSESEITTAAQEQEAKYIGTASMPSLTWVDGENDVTKNATWVARIDSQFKMDDIKSDNGTSVNEPHNYYYAAILLNFLNMPQIAIEDGTFKDLYEKVATHQEISYNVFRPTEEDKYSDLAMSSAPKWQSESADPLTLVPFDLTAIKWVNDYEATQVPEVSEFDKEAATFYVQRNVAKVTYGNGTTLDFTIEKGPNEGDKIKIESWGLDITNRTSYYIQNTNGLANAINEVSSKGHFHGAGGSGFERVHWAFDPNYESADLNTNFFRIQTSSNKIAGASWYQNTKNALYCYENTMDFSQMKQDQTTRVVFQGSYYPAGSYTPGKFFTIGNDPKAYTAETFKKLILEKFKDVKDITLNSTYSTGANNSYCSLKNLITNVSVVSTSTNKTTVEKIAERWGITADQANTVTYYGTGNVYYTVAIRHFDDDEAAVEKDQDTQKVKEYTVNQLGRYGVLRNNWYEVTINSFSGPGPFTLKDPTDDPDDPDPKDPFDPEEPEFGYVGFIKASVNILTWTKRSQGVDF